MCVLQPWCVPCYTEWYPGKRGLLPTCSNIFYKKQKRVIFLFKICSIPQPYFTREIQRILWKSLDCCTLFHLWKTTEQWRWSYWLFLSFKCKSAWICLNVGRLSVNWARKAEKRTMGFERAKLKCIDLFFFSQKHITRDVSNDADWNKEWEGEWFHTQSSMEEWVSCSPELSPASFGDVKSGAFFEQKLLMVYMHCCSTNSAHRKWSLELNIDKSYGGDYLLLGEDLYWKCSSSQAIF